MEYQPNCRTTYLSIATSSEYQHVSVKTSQASDAIEETTKFPTNNTDKNLVFSGPNKGLLIVD